MVPKIKQHLLLATDHRDPRADAHPYAGVAAGAGSVPCIVLGAGGALAPVAKHVHAVARAGGWAGFTVGRSGWTRRSTTGTTGAERPAGVEHVADGYVRLIDAHLQAP